MEVTITLNGESTTFPEGTTLSALVKKFGYSMSNVVAELNGAVIRPTNYATVVLKDDDKLELLNFVGGG